MFKIIYDVILGLVWWKSEPLEVERGVEIKTQAPSPTPVKKKIPPKPKKVYTKNKPALMRRYLADPRRKKQNFNQWCRKQGL